MNLTTLEAIIVVTAGVGLAALIVEQIAYTWLQIVKRRKEKEHE